MARLRTFIAVEIDRFSRDRLVGLQERLSTVSSGVKWVEPQNLHLTLLFLGEIDDREVVDICRTVETVCCDVAPFPMTLAGTGAFPTPRRPRTLIVHVTEGADELKALYAALEKPLLELGCFRREDRAYTPHLTLGRVKSDPHTDELASVIKQFAQWQGGQTQVREVLVMSSQLRQVGPEYTVLSRAKLEG